MVIFENHFETLRFEILSAFPWIALTLLERLFNDFLLITVYCTEFVYFFT